MDTLPIKRGYSKPCSVYCSPVPHFFVTSIFGKSGRWATHFNFLKFISSGITRETVSNPTWQKKHKRLFKKLCVQAGDSNATHIPLLFNIEDNTTKLREEFHNKNVWANEPASPWWLLLEAIAKDVSASHSDSPQSHFLMFLTTLKNVKFTHEEMLMVMLCVVVK